MREEVEDRDGYCRLQGVARFSPCEGPGEWAHFGEFKRWKTRGKDMTERHVRHGSLKLCKRHHGLYDQHVMAIDATTDKGTDGPLRFEMGGQEYVELVA